MTSRRWTTAELEGWAKRRIARIDTEKGVAAWLDSKVTTSDHTARGKRIPIAGRLYPLCLLCNAHGLPEPMPEYVFHPTRGWRADYCWVEQKILIEIDGGVHTGGRHVRGEGFIEDQRKLNAATLLGYRVLRYTPDRLGEAIEDLKVLLA